MLKCKSKFCHFYDQFYISQVSFLMTCVNSFCRFKFFEVLGEAFPQSVLGIYMVLVLQQDEPLNYLSISISLVSLIYGIAESITYQKFDHRAPFSKIVLSGLSGIVDTAFRVLFISFFASLSSPYSMFLLPMIYSFTMYLSLSIKHKKIKLETWEVYACFMSLPSSIYEHDKINYTLRPNSKIVFNTLAVICLCFNTGQFWEEYPELKRKDLPLNTTTENVFGYCENICNVTDISICSTFNQSEKLYHGILISLWALLALSTLEGILERYLSFMPHCKFLEEIPSEDKDAKAVSEEGIELGQRDIQAEA